MASSRPKITITPGAPARDPRRSPVRGANAPARAKREVQDARDAQAPRGGGPGTEPARQQRALQRPVEQAPQHPAGQAQQRPPRPADARVPAQAPWPSRPSQPSQPSRPSQPSQPSRPSQRPRPPHEQPQHSQPQPNHTPRSTATPTAPPRTATEGFRVAKLITDRGLASRREADEWIEAGWVRVDGRLAVLGQRAQDDAVIDIDPRARAEQARRVTVLINKPVGYVSGQAEDGYEPAFVLVTPANHWGDDASGIQFQNGHLRHLAPAGRLDIDSTGLLVLTQDGRVAKRLIGDETRVEKEYLVRVAHQRPGPVPEETLERLRHGLELDGVQLRPARVSWQNEDQLRIVLREGRKRQIRRMCEMVGLQVLGLKRVRIGSVPLGVLPVGQWRYLRDDERF